jgi:hypothetical protein
MFQVQQRFPPWLNLATPVLAAPYSTMSVTFVVCDGDAEVVATVMV